MLKGITIGLFCFLAFLSHIFFFHYFNIRRKFFTILMTFLSMLLVYAILFIMVPEERVEAFIMKLLPISLLAFLNGAFLHFFFGYFYLHFIQIIDRTPTTRIMIEINNSPNKKLSLDEIKSLYSIDKKVSDELDDMVILGRLEKRQDCYSITPKGKAHLSLFSRVRDYLKLERN